MTRTDGICDDCGEVCDKSTCECTDGCLLEAALRANSVVPRDLATEREAHAATRQALTDLVRAVGAGWQDPKGIGKATEAARAVPGDT